jgi:hypothetical protein
MAMLRATMAPLLDGIGGHVGLAVAGAGTDVDDGTATAADHVGIRAARLMR